MTEILTQVWLIVYNDSEPYPLDSSSSCSDAWRSEGKETWWHLAVKEVDENVVYSK